MRTNSSVPCGPLLLLITAGIFGWLSAAATCDEPAPPRLPRENLLVYRSSDSKLLPVTDLQHWKTRRDEIIRGMASVMGSLPGSEKRCPLDLQIQEEVDCGTYVRRFITYASEPKSRVTAYLLVPKTALSAKAAPAVLCLHPTDNKIGHKVVVGLGGKPNRQYAAELAEKGFVTLAPSYPQLAEYWPDLDALGWESGTLKAVWDNVRGLDLLDSLPYVRRERGYGVIGHSLGGHNSVYTAVFDDRLKIVVSSCGLDSYLDYYNANPKVWEKGKGWTQDRYMKKLADFQGRLEEIPFDFHEMIGVLAPRKVFIAAPLKDSNFRWDSVDRVVASAKKVYALYGQPDALRVEHPDCDHDFPDEMRAIAYELFQAL